MKTQLLIVLFVLAFKQSLYVYVLLFRSVPFTSTGKH